MNRPWRFVTLIALITAGVSCSNSREDDFAAAEFPAAPTQQLAAVDEWTLELVRPDGRLPCWQVRIDDQTTSCNSVEVEAGAFSLGSIRGPRSSFEWFTAGGDQPYTFLWFSSLHDGLVVDSYTVEGSQFAVVEVADGEEPWGVQILDADGALVHAWSVVDEG
jgi:hypothetical protein